MNEVIWERTYFDNNSQKEKRIRLIHGDVVDEHNEYDVLLCSAYMNSYYPSQKTLIGSLYRKRRINVDSLAKNPEIDIKKQGFWLSKKIDSNFHRIGCIEILQYGHKHDVSDVLKNRFFTLRYGLEISNMNGIKIEKVAMTLLGSGQQNIELHYVINPLLYQIENTLKAIESLECVDIYEINKTKAESAASLLKQITDSDTETSQSMVFISYSTHQSKEAQQIKKIIEDHGYKCWMAPYSIPTGSSYLEQIPIAIRNSSVMVLILTPEAEASVWVIKEASTAVGSSKVLIPYQLKEYPLGDEFSFLLTDIQRLICNEDDPKINLLLDRIKESI